MNALLLIAYLGTASFVFDFGGTRILTDPGDFFTGRLTVETAREIADIDLVCLTHGHFDHTNRLIHIPGSRVIPILGTETARTLFPGFDIRTEREFRIRDILITAFPSVHGVSHWEEHRSYLIDKGGFRICFLGDAYKIDPSALELIKEPDILFVTLGTFETNPENALKNLALIKPKRVVPMHWETFCRGEEKAREFAKAVEKRFPSIECLVPEIGGSFQIIAETDF